MWKEWKEVFFAGTEWSTYQDIFKVDWDFDHLEEALSKGGALDGKPVYLFGTTEPQLVQLSQKDVKTETVVPIPCLIAVQSTYQLPSIIGLNSVTRGHEELVPMEKMKMAWLPYEGELDGKRVKPGRIFVLKCVQRRAAVRQLKEERVRSFEYVLPYIFKPEAADDDEGNTTINIMATLSENQVYPLEFDWELDELDDFVDEFAKTNELDDAAKDKLRDIIKDEVRAAKLKKKEAKLARQKRVDDMSEAERTALRTMKVHKFYPQNKFPDIAHYKTKYVNRYFGKADELH